MQLAPGIWSFLDLPWEIRDNVYTALLQSEEPLPHDIGPRRTTKPVVPPKLATAELLCCNRQIHDELKSKMKLWQKKGWARYRLHVRVFREGQPVRIWRRVTIPLQYIHTLELDIHSRGTAFFSRALLPVEVHKLVLDFFEYGPELALPHKPKFWPLVDTVVINIGSLDSDHAVHTGPDIELDDPREASMPALIRAAVTDILYSYHFDELRNFLGYYLRTMQVRYEGYVFERLVEPDPPEAVIDTAF